jgi:hypothetical protein
MPEIEAFLRQRPEESAVFEETVRKLIGAVK